MNKLNVLLVEDSITYCHIISTLGDSKGNFECCRNLQSARDAISNTVFDIIFLDLHLPDGDSIDFCHQLTTDPKLINSFVVFISSESKLEWRLRAFDAGAKDFIDKGIGQKELAAKMDALFDYQSKRLLHLQHLTQETREITSDHFKIQIDNNALISFNKQCLQLSSIEQLKTNLSNFLNHWGLHYIACISVADDCLYINNDDITPSPMELELFTELGNKGTSVQSFGTNTYFKYGNVELLIKNMPVKDELSYGRLKDLFHFVTEVIDVRYKEQIRFNNIENICAGINSHIPSVDNPLLLKLLDDLSEQVSELKPIIVEDEDNDIVFF